MERADLVYKLVDELEPVLERYASTGIEIAVLITKVNDNVVGYQGTKLGKDFLEKNTHFTETFRKFCKDYWYGTDNVLTFSSPKKMDINSGFTLSNEKDSETEISNIILQGDGNTVLPISGFESLALLNDEQTTLTSILGNSAVGTPKPRIVLKSGFLDGEYSPPGSAYFERKKITRKAKYRCSLCETAYFRREHRLNIHMHEYHGKELTEKQLEAFPLPVDYKKNVEVVINEKGEQEVVQASSKSAVPIERKRKMIYRYYCQQCDIKFKKLERFNEHREKRHSQHHVKEDHGIHTEGYQCEYCPKVFASHWNLQRHLDLHLGNRKFKCEKCDQNFFRREELYKHLTKHKEGSKASASRGKITCYSCNEPIRFRAGPNCAIPDSHENDKEMLRNEPIYDCKSCNAVFKSKMEYEAHMIQHEGLGKDILSEHDYISTVTTEDKDVEAAIKLIKKAEDMNKEGTNTKETSNVDEEMHDGNQNNSNKDEFNDYSDDDNVDEVNKNTDVYIIDSGSDENPDSKHKDETGRIVKIEEDLTKERKPFEKMNYKGAFTCAICSKSFVTRFVLKRHILLHSNRISLKCQHCSNMYSRSDLLCRHIKQKHGKVKAPKPTLKLKCDVCYARCKDDFGLRYHKYSIHGIGKKIKLTCKVCIPNVTFSSLKYLRKHQQRLHSKSSDDAAGTPETVFKEAESVAKEHTNTRKRSHSLTKSSDSETTALSPLKAKAVKTSVTPSGKIPYVPSETITRSKSNKMLPSSDKRSQSNNSSKKTFQTSCSLTSKSGNKKVSFASNSTYPDVKRNKPNEGFEFSISSKSHENYSCDQCNKCFRYQSEFNSHMLIHSSKKVYPCAMCCLVFLEPTSLKTHNDKHDDNGNFSCLSCVFQTDSFEHLKRHRSHHNIKNRKHQFSAKTEMINKKQTAAKTESEDSNVDGSTRTKSMNKATIVCEHCGKEFSSVSRLKLHEHVHSGVIHRCQICDRSFNSLVYLNKHETVHVNTKPFPCHDCGMSFHQHSTLLTHQLKHGPGAMQCDHCPAKFRKLADLDYHKTARHSGQIPEEDLPKPNKCGVSGKVFEKKSLLDQHRSSHKDRTTYSGNVCKKTFTDSDDCRAHEKEHSDSKTNHCKYCDKSYVRNRDLKTHMKRLHKDLTEEQQEGDIIDLDAVVKDIEDRLNKNQNEVDHHDSQIDPVSGEISGALDNDGSAHDSIERSEEEAVTTTSTEQNLSCNNDTSGTNDMSDSEDLRNLDTNNDNIITSSENGGENVDNNTLNSNRLIDSENEKNNFTKLDYCKESEPDSSELETTVSGTALKTITPSSVSKDENLTSSTSTVGLNTCNTSTSDASDLTSVTDQMTLPSSITELSPEAQHFVQSVILQSGDNASGPSTIYVVQSEDNSSEPKVIYVVSDSKVD